MTISDLKKLSEEKKSQIIDRLGGQFTTGNYYEDLNSIHIIEVMYLEILVEFSHWLQLSDIMGLSRAGQIGHWPAESHERADAFIFTISKFLDIPREKLKNERFRVFQDLIKVKKIF